MATHGEIRWPPMGTFDGRLRGDSHGRRQLRSSPKPGLSNRRAEPAATYASLPHRPAPARSAAALGIWAIRAERRRRTPRGKAELPDGIGERHGDEPGSWFGHGKSARLSQLWQPVRSPHLEWWHRRRSCRSFRLAARHPGVSTAQRDLQDAGQEVVGPPQRVRALFQLVLVGSA
jgi:hypothetical protein